MKQLLRFCFFSMLVLFVTAQAQAQTTLIHYWHFNGLAQAYNNPNIPALAADYSVLDTSKAKIVYVREPGTSPTYLGYIDNVASTDTTNNRLGQVSGQGLRVRNPTDSMELRFYLPTKGYKNIVLKYALESSSTTSGDSTQLFDYSVDSGKTWKKGVTVNGVKVDTLDTTPAVYQGTSWGLVAITFGTDTTVNNNPGFVFRIKFKANSSKTSGNNRFDNVTLDGVPNAPASLALIHYWHFNNLAQAYNNPNIPALAADYSALDTSKAKVVYVREPGTSATYLGYIDNVASTDTTNNRLGQVSGQGLRVRNPTDSMELRWYIPTTGYTGIVLKYALESSSTTSGDSTQLFDYSIDSGKTWKTGDMTVNGVKADTLDTTPAVYQGTSWGLVAITFGTDAATNNNPGLVFRVKFIRNSNKTSGNNRFDNITVEGFGAVKPPPAAITLVKPVGGEIFVSGRHAALSFTTFGPVTDNRTLEYSTDAGATWTKVGTLTKTSSYDWIVPNTPTATALLRVKDDNGISSTSKAFTIYTVTKSNTLVQYWNFNTLLKQYNNPTIPSLQADFSATENGVGNLVYKLLGSKTYTGFIDNVAGDTLNARLGSIAGQGFRVRNPTDSMELRIYMPTTGFSNIKVSYALQSSDSNLAPLMQHYDYSVDSGATWKTAGLSQTTLNVQLPQYQNLTKFGLVSLNFTNDTTVNNNSKLVLRIAFTGMTNITSGNNRFDNLTVDGTPIPAAVAQNAQQLGYVLSPNPAQNRVTIVSPSAGERIISIVDLTGKEVLRSTENGSSALQINTTNLTAGTYFARILDTNGAMLTTMKFVKE